MPILKLLIGAVVVAVFAVGNSFISHLRQQEASIKNDLALYEEICDATDASKACADQLLAGTVSTVGLLLAADERRHEGGPLGASDLEEIRAEWRRRYEAQTGGRIYPALANACADHLGDRCPGFVVLSSWGHQLTMQRALVQLAETEA